MLKWSAVFRIFIIVGRNQSTRTQSSVTSTSRFKVGCVLSAGEDLNRPCVNFLSFLFFVISLTSQPPLHPEMRLITPAIMRSYWMFIIDKSDLTEVSYASRRIPHLIWNIQETSNLRHARIISSNVAGAHLSNNVHRWRIFTYYWIWVLWKKHERYSGRCTFSKLGRELIVEVTFTLLDDENN